MLTIKKRRRALQILAALALANLTACGPPGARDLHQGQRLIDNNQFKEAIPVLADGARALQTQPPAVQAVAWNLLGLAYHGAGQLDSASKAYLQALKLNRDLWAADFNLGCLRLEQANYAAAIDCLTTYTTANPKDAEAFRLLGRARVKYAVQCPTGEKARQLDAARKDYQYSDQLKNSAEACNALGMLELQRRLPRIDPVEAALHDFNLALERDPHYAPAILNTAIVLQRYARQPREALEKYRQYVALNPAPANAQEVQELARDLDMSLRISIVPRNAAAPSSVAPIPTNTGPPAQSQFQTPRQPAVDTKPTSTPPESAPSTRQPAPARQPSHSLILGDTGAKGGATAVPPPQTQTPTLAPPSNAPPPEVNQTASSEPAETAADLSPQDVNTNNGTASAQKKSIVQKLNPLTWFGKSDSGAVAAGRRYDYPAPVTPIPGDRNEAVRLVNEARQAQRQSNLPDAIRDYQNALKADPTDFDAALDLGLAAVDAKDYGAALDALNQSLQLQKDSADARYAFAWVLDKKGYFQDAANELNKLLSAHPTEARARLLLGNIYAESLGQPKLAREQYLKALPLIDPKSTQAAVIQTWLQKHQ